MERTCTSCGRDPGDGASCRHCGAAVYRYAVSSEEWDEAAGPDGMLSTDDDLDDLDLDDIEIPDAVIPPPDAEDLGFEPLPPSFTPPPARPTPSPPVRPAGATGPSPQPSSTARGCGCSVAIFALIALVGIGIALFFFSSARFEFPGGVAEVTATAGQCVDLVAGDGIVSDTTVVPCDGPHDAEAFHRAEFGEGAFPGDAVVADEAEARCLDEFEAYVGIDYYDSEYWIDWLVPTADGWASGNREVVCLLVSGDGSPLTGSAYGSGR